MVMIVADAILETGWGTRWLNPPDEPLLGKQSQRVVHRLSRNGADLRTNFFGDVIRRRMGFARNGTQHGDSLCRDLQTMFSKKMSVITGHNQDGNVYF